MKSGQRYALLPCLALALLGSARVQTAAAPAASWPAFDAVSVKVSALRLSPALLARLGDIGLNGGAKMDPGHFTVEGATARYLIEQAYGFEGYQLTGGPDWTHNDLFAISATVVTPTAPDRMRLMLRRLLAERFQITLAAQDATMPVYDLVVAPGGPKFKPLGADDACRSGGIGEDDLKAAGAPPDSRGSFHDCSIASLVHALNTAGPQSAGRPVIDQTSLAGRYNLTVWQKIYSREPVTGPGIPDGAFRMEQEPFTESVQQELGLKLAPATATVHTFVIASISRPTPD